MKVHCKFRGRTDRVLDFQKVPSAGETYGTLPGMSTHGMRIRIERVGVGYNKMSGGYVFVDYVETT